MTIERLLQLCIAALVAYSALLLGLGEQDPRLPVVAAIASAASFYVTDLRGWWRLGDRLASLCALAAVVYAFVDLGQFGAESWLLAVANLLVYLQVILQFQTKLVRRYWMLMVLSVLEVSVATVVNSDMLFGVLQVGYLFLGAATMVVFYLHRETIVHAAPHEWPDVSHAPSSNQAGGAGRAFSAQTPVDLARRNVLAPALNEVALVCVLTLAMTAVVFLLVPRVGRSAWRPSGATIQHVVGASQRVQLGELGDVIESPEGVMQVRFYSLAGEHPYELVGEPLFRGLHLTRYEGGYWDQPRPSNAEGIEPAQLAAMPAHAVRQVIQMEPLDTDVLYCVSPVAISEANDDLLYDDARQQFVRSERAQREQFRFQVITSGLVNGRQYPILPSGEFLNRNYAPYHQVPRGADFERLRNLALQIVEEIPPENRLERARRLERYFSEAGRFTYALTSPPRDPEVDPIVDFLFDRPQGHCEYYASALALMLRSVDIPSRLVLGFKGGEWNSLGGFYQVRQLHAHAWVEAYLEPDQLPDNLPELARGRTRARWSKGGWVVLDPTPAADGTVGAAESWFAIPSLRQFADYAHYLWSNYVVGMDADRQRENIYLPVWNAVVAFASAAVDPRTYRDIWQGTIVLLNLDRTGWFGGNWFSWRAGLFGSTLALFVILATRLVRRLWRRLLGWERFAALRGARRGVEVEFYRRLESLLARFGMVRPAAQTQREFAAAARTRLAEMGIGAGAALAPQRVVEAFYRVRFGRASLDKVETETVEQSLALLEAALPSRRGRHKSPA